MNKLLDITKQIINRPAQLGSSGGVLTNIAKWATWTKYASIASFAIAIVAIVTINAVGGGLSRLRDYQSASAADDANSGISTYATNVSDAASIISFTFSNATGSVSSDGRSVTVDIQSPDSGGIATGRHTVNIQSNSIAGYIVTVEGSGGSTALSPADFGGSTTTNNHLINPVSGTIASPSTLGSNTWGMAIPGRNKYSAEAVYTAGLPAASGGTNGGVENMANQATLRMATFGQIPAKTNAATIIESNQASGPAHDGSAADTQNIYYGVNTEPTLQAGEYSTTITYTATVKLPSAPTNLSVSPNTYELGSGDPSTVTISATSGLASAYNVWVDLNGNNTYDANEQCTNLNVASDTKLTCTVPTDQTNPDLEPGDYTIHVVTQGGEDTIGFSYTESKILSIYDQTDNVRVDWDENMIPVYYTGSTSTARWTSLTPEQIEQNSTTWFDYSGSRTSSGPKWANAVTVKDPEKYKNKGLVVDEADILGYWVYIPRYSYQVMRRDATDKVVTDEEAIAMGGFNIKFETTNDFKRTPKACINSSSSRYYQDCVDTTYPTEERLANQTAWATHPAFTWQYTQDINGFDKTYELNGFWIGKFETTGSTSQPTVLPNQKHMSQYSGNIGDMYNVAKSMGVADPDNKYGNTTSTSQSNQNNNNLAISTSHMLKNSEWGAVAYLSASKYGAGVNNVQINSQYESGTDGNGDSSYGITGYGPNGSSQYNTENGQLASTTNNIYGVYDMAGGAYEYVMGSYTNDSTQSYPSNDYIVNKVKPPYVDLYPDSIFTNNDVYTNNNQCTWATCGGHALYETKNVQSVSRYDESWGGANSNFVESSYPWFIRGGSVYNGSDAGVFDSTRSSGGTSNILGNGFRVALMSLPQG